MRIKMTKKTLLIIISTVWIALFTQLTFSAPSDFFKAWRKIDPPPVYRIDPPSRNTYAKPQTKNKNNVPIFRNWKDLQAEHAWDRRSNIFIKRGINNVEELKSHAAYIRKNYDEFTILQPLDKGTPRYAYGKYDSQSRTKGLIVIDNPGDTINGGTIINNNNLKIKFRNWK
jgi:hypothetical protein